MSTLPERLRSARERKGISQVEVSRRIGINNKTLSGYENGVSQPDAETIRKLAEVYEVSTDYLLGVVTNSIDKLRQNKQTVDNNLSVDPEWIELYQKVKEMGAELEATTLLRSASNMSKAKLRALIMAFDAIMKEDD